MKYEPTDQTISSLDRCSGIVFTVDLILTVKTQFSHIPQNGNMCVFQKHSEKVINWTKLELIWFIV